MNVLCAMRLGRDMRTSPICLGGKLPRGPHVYFLAGEGRIKVGFSKNLEGRIRLLRSQSLIDLIVIGYLSGGRPLERSILVAAEPYRISGEWFHDCVEMRSIVDLACTTGGAAFPTGAGRAKRVTDCNVSWASQKLKEIAGARGADDSIQEMIDRAATKIGSSYWRAFDLWYGKARQLTIAEKEAIQAAGAAS